MAEQIPYTVTFPDGHKLTFTGPSDMTDADVEQRARQERSFAENNTVSPAAIFGQHVKESLAGFGKEALPAALNVALALAKPLTYAGLPALGTEVAQTVTHPDQALAALREKFGAWTLAPAYEQGQALGGLSGSAVGAAAGGELMAAAPAAVSGSLRLAPQVVKAVKAGGTELAPVRFRRAAEAAHEAFTGASANTFESLMGKQAPTLSVEEMLKGTEGINPPLARPMSSPMVPQLTPFEQLMGKAEPTSSTEVMRPAPNPVRSQIPPMAETPLPVAAKSPTPALKLPTRKTVSPVTQMDDILNEVKTRGSNDPASSVELPPESGFTKGGQPAVGNQIRSTMARRSVFGRDSANSDELMPNKSVKPTPIIDSLEEVDPRGGPTSNNGSSESAASMEAQSKKGWTYTVRNRTGGHVRDIVGIDAQDVSNGLLPRLPPGQYIEGLDTATGEKIPLTGDKIRFKIGSRTNVWTEAERRARTGGK